MENARVFAWSRVFPVGSDLDEREIDHAQNPGLLLEARTNRLGVATLPLDATRLWNVWSTHRLATTSGPPERFASRLKRAVVPGNDLVLNLRDYFLHEVALLELDSLPIEAAAKFSLHFRVESDRSWDSVFDSKLEPRALDSDAWSFLQPRFVVPLEKDLQQTLSVEIPPLPYEAFRVEVLDRTERIACRPAVLGDALCPGRIPLEDDLEQSLRELRRTRRIGVCLGPVPPRDEHARPAHALPLRLAAPASCRAGDAFFLLSKERIIQLRRDDARLLAEDLVPNAWDLVLVRKKRLHALLASKRVDNAARPVIPSLERLNELRVRVSRADGTAARGGFLELSPPGVEAMQPLRFAVGPRGRCLVHAFAGSIQVLAWHPVDGDREQQLTIRAEDSQRASLVLEPYHIVHGVTQDSDGSPIPFARVRTTSYPLGRRRTQLNRTIVRCDADGGFVFRASQSSTRIEFWSMAFLGPQIRGGLRSPRPSVYLPAHPKKVVVEAN